MDNKFLQTLALIAIGYTGLTACNTHVSAWTDAPLVNFNNDECDSICSGKADLKAIQNRVLKACETLNPNGKYKNRINYFNDSVTRQLNMVKNYEQRTSRAPDCKANCKLGKIAAVCE